MKDHALYSIMAPTIGFSEKVNRLGQYLGWKMVRNYIFEEEISLAEMVKIEYKDILKNTTLDMAKTKTSKIKIQVDLNENNLPIEMRWEAEGSDMNKSMTSAFLLSLWDPNEKNTMKIDLWTKDMSIEEMKQFFHQSLLSMADTFERQPARILFVKI